MTKKKSPAQLSREIAESLASNVKTATRRLPAGQLDGAALAEALPAYKGWTPAWEYPGFLAFHRGDLSVLCTPDYHRPGTIAIDVQHSDGTSIGGGRDLAWPMAKRTPASFMKLMRPVLEVHLKGRRASTSPSRHHSTKKQPDGNRAWYVFYIPKGRMPKSFGGKSGWDWPKAYFGPYESRAAATSAVQGEMAVFEEPSARYKIRNVTPQEFAKLWGNPPQSNFADPWSAALKKRGHA